MVRFPFVRSALALVFALGLATATRAQVAVIGNGCQDLPLALQHSAVPAPGAGGVLTIGNPLPPGQGWIGLLALGAPLAAPMPVFDPGMFACYAMPQGQPAPIQVWVDPLAVYFFYDVGGTVSLTIPPGPALTGLVIAAEGVYGQALLRATQALAFTL